MPYSFTEKKRIRKSFAKRDNVHQVPFLLATQLESYEKFLQADVPPLKRKNEGLQSAFTSIFPIVSHNGFARLEFISYTLGDPPFDVKECQQRGLTLASPLRAKVRLVILDKESPTKPVVKEMKEQVRKMVANGDDVRDVFTQARRELQELGIYKMNVEQNLREILKSKDILTEQDMEDSIKAANAMLEAKGIAPIQVGGLARHLIKRRIERQRDKRAASQKR